METPKAKSISEAEVLEVPASEDDDREPTKEELLEDLRIALRDVMAGKKMMPARESIEALRQRIYGNANDG